jgi:hypothetical protein
MRISPIIACLLVSASADSVYNNASPSQDDAWSTSPSSVKPTVLSDGDLASDSYDLLKSLLDRERATYKFLHMVDYASSPTAVNAFHKHEAIVSWSVISHDTAMSSSLKSLYASSNRVSVKTIAGDFSAWTQSENPAAFVDYKTEEGTLSEFQTYVDELKFFGAKDTNKYWVMAFGKARVDVGIAALPLLVEKQGYLAVDRWVDSACAQETLLRFYEVVLSTADVAVLKPRSPQWIAQMQASGQYDWCYSWDSDRAVVRTYNGPSDTAGAMQVLQETVGCDDFFGTFECANENEKCISCYAALMATTKRGFLVQESLKKSVEAAKAIAANNVDNEL